jgi:SAM-dependent methyltransferase|tara:strand:- start:19 stop:858 length:840 start_codon:yes stop_codon:yes gene_type:complete
LSHKIWKRPENLISGQEYTGNQLVAKVASEKGFSAIIDEYVYIHPENVEKTFNIIPNSSEFIHGIGIDLGGGVGCISSTLAKRENVEKIYCVELVEEAVTMCQPIVKKEILKENDNKVISVVGDFDYLDLENNSIDFAVSWDSMHHSMDLINTLKECKRVLKKNGVFIIVDRAHNNSTPDSEIERMLNIVYDEKFLTKFYRPKDMVLTRRENGEHEHRFFEWDKFFDGSGFKLIDCVVIKTESDENRKLKNDNNVKEVFVNYDLGAFGNRKVAFVLRSI